MKTATLAQGVQILDLVRAKETPLKQVQEILASGLLSDLLDANVSSINRSDFRKVCGLQSGEVIATVSTHVLTDKFGFFLDLGLITVPEDYNHATYLASFRENNYKKFFGYNDNITDSNYSNPTRILKPGDKLWVRAIRQLASGTTTSEERIAFLKKHNGILVGAQGAGLVFKQKCKQLKRAFWYSSFDEKERLPFVDGYHRVPVVYVRSDGDFSFSLGRLECVWYGRFAFLCFCDPTCLETSQHAETANVDE